MLTKTVLSKLPTFIFVCVSLSFATLSHAQITNVQGSPQNFNLALAHTSYTKLRWNITVNFYSPGTFTSNSIIIRAGSATGPIVFTVNKTVTVNAAQGISSHKVLETILLPSRVTYRIRKLNMTRVYITRTFTDNTNSMTGIMVASLTGQIAAKFSLSFLKLRVVNNESKFMPERTSSSVARANLKFNGSGTVHAIWEIATVHASTAGSRQTSVFRPLKQVVKYISSNQITLFSPPLPTTKESQYIVRLRIISPQVIKNDLPTLLYTPSIGRSKHKTIDQ